jgi:SAM-dependent methyltransferase
MTDPFGRSVTDHYHGRRTEPLLVRDGTETREHPIESFYFEPFEAESDAGRWLSARVRGPLLDVGAGTGRHALVFGEQVETVAVDVSERLVRVMRERGVRDARVVDMFSLREAFDRDRFGSALVVGTQLGLAASMQGLRRWLGDLAFVTDAEATAVVDSYDPTCDEADELLGYRADLTTGLAHRVFHFAYEGAVSETLLFRLFSPDRLREATVGTGWTVDDVWRSGADTAYYRAALTKV